jgi:hypothetical protein
VAAIDLKTLRATLEDGREVRVLGLWDGAGDEIDLDDPDDHMHAVAFLVGPVGPGHCLSGALADLKKRSRH